MHPDSLKQIIGLSQQAAGVQIHNIAGDPRHQLVFGPNGHEFREVPPAPRDHLVNDLESLLAAVAMPSVPDGTSPSSIWHDDESVILLCDDFDRLDRVTLTLVHSAQFIALMQLTDARPFTQSDLIRFLRLRLDAYGVEMVLPVLRKLDFSRKSSGAATIEHGKESLGRSVEATVTGTRDIPERFTVSVPVYQNGGCAHDHVIELLLEIDAQTERFYLVTAPDELADAIQAAQGEIDTALLSDERVKTGNVAVYYGSPDSK